MKMTFLITLIFSFPLFCAEDSFQVKFQGDSVGFACTRAKGLATSKIQAMCNRKDLVMDWEKSNFGECRYKKDKKASAEKRWTATWTIQPACIKGKVKKDKKGKKGKKKKK